MYIVTGHIPLVRVALYSVSRIQMSVTWPLGTKNLNIHVAGVRMGSSNDDVCNLLSNIDTK